MTESRKHTARNSPDRPSLPAAKESSGTLVTFSGQIAGAKPGFRATRSKAQNKKMVPDLSASLASKPLTDPAALDAGDDSPDEDIPELTEAFAAKAELHKAGKKIGRPKSANAKLLVTLRLDPNVIAHFREEGPGWQTRINEALARVVKRAR